MLVRTDSSFLVIVDLQKTEDRSQMTENRIIRSVRDLKVYNQAYALAMEIFEITKKFPKEETYSLTDQIRRSSRSVAMNIREGYAKKHYNQIFIRMLNDAFGSSEETRGWLDFATDCKYLPKDQHNTMDKQYDELNAMLYGLINKWENYAAK